MIHLNAVLIRLMAFWGGFFFFLLLEYVRPYRNPTVAKAKRVMTNISLAIINSAILTILFAAATANEAAYVTEHRVGLLNMVALPLWANVTLTVLVMDFMLYVWHMLNHKVPLFWRFHRVHHSDINMDVSTASRFHIGELSISAVIKLGLIYFLGAGMVGVIIFESLLVLAAQFQHSSLRVPKSLESVFWTVFVPPSMHRIHHSVKVFERDTNYGTILSVWDRMLGTLVRDVSQETIVIGVGPYREPDKLGLPTLILMPFTKQIR